MSYLYPTKMMWLLKLPFDQNPIMIDYKSNCDFNSYIIFSRTQVGFLKLLKLFSLDRLLGR
jgi:hypothetical protein